jgi:type IV secretion system protein VirB1
MACGSTVDPGTLQAIIRVESGSRPLAINVNHLPSQPPPARDAATAGAVASHWISLGYSVDLGLMQVNSRNLSALGYTVSQMFDPCTNVRAGAAILTADYLSARATRPDPQIALQAALSDYNSGTFDRGFWNGYVSKYYGPAATAAGFPHIITAGFRALPTSIPPNPYTADPSVYTRKDTPLD